jgi:protein-tyrosine-phosphatase
MSDDASLAPGVRAGLAKVAQDLQAMYQGVFGLETIQDLVSDSYRRLAATAKVTKWLVIGAERFATERLNALVQAEMRSDEKVPSVLFLCVHNAGRSQMALGWFAQLAGDRAMAWSGGSEPGDSINESAIAVMAEIGIDISRQFPKLWTDEFFQAADVVVTMGCGDACPLVPGKHYEDWELEDPSGRTVEEVRLIRDEIRRRVVELMRRLDIETIS